MPPKVRKALTAAEKQKRYREKRKLDHERENEYKKKALERYHENKNLIENQTNREKRQTRKKWRTKKRNQRKSKRNLETIVLNTPPSTPTTANILNAANNRSRGRKKVLLHRTKLFRENLKLAEKINKLKKNVEKYKKQAVRNKQKNKKLMEQNFTPLAKTNSLIEECFPNSRSAPAQKVKRVLFNYNILTHSLKAKYLDLKKNSEKKNLKSVVVCKLLRKYRILRQVGSEALAIQAGRERAQKPKELPEIRKRIHKFFLRDDVSCATAGKKETVTKNKVKEQKRYMLDTLINLHKKFISEPENYVSYSYFTLNRPFYVVQPTIQSRDTCACKLHCNIVLKTSVLKKLNVISTVNLPLLLKMAVCDTQSMECMYNKCTSCENKTVPLNVEDSNVEVYWMEWLRQHEIYEKDGKTKKIFKTVKVRINGKITTLIKKFNEEMILLKKHSFNIKMQYQAYRNCVDNLTENAAAIHIDFSENYNCKYAEEIQSHHFGGSRKQITLHTGVIYFFKNDPLSFCTISSNNEHSPSAIWAHLDPVFQMIRNNKPGIDTLHFFSDGPCTQYRQKQNFYLFSHKIFEKNYKGGTWSFFESGHGKGAADGIGGTVKRIADRIVAHGRDIANANDFFELVQQETSIQLFLIATEAIERVRSSLPKLIPILPGTMQLHQLIAENSGLLKYRDLSCFACDTRGFCACFNPKLYITSPEKSLQTRVGIYDLIYSPTSSENSFELEEELSPNKHDLFTDTSKIKTGTFIFLKMYVEKKEFKTEYKYVAVVQEVEADEIQVMFLKSVDKTKTLFKTQENDVSYIKMHQIVKILPNPNIKMKGGRLFYQFGDIIDVCEK